jgi:hypothetical protein
MTGIPSLFAFGLVRQFVCLMFVAVTKGKAEHWGPGGNGMEFYSESRLCRRNWHSNDSLEGRRR